MDEKLIEFEANFSVLDRYGTDVTASEFITNPAIGRDEQIKELILILLTPEKSAILIGKPGIGKTAIVEGLAYRLQRNDVPDALKGYTIINIKTASLLGTMPSGESKVQKMIDELKTRDKVILFVDEIHMLIGATDSSALDFANIFKEGLGRGSIKVIGATTTEEYERYILRDKAFTRRFQKVDVPEPTREETVKIMLGTLPKFEKQTGRKMKYTPFIKERIMTFLVDITSEYKRIFALGSRYPDVCLTLLKQAFSYTVYDNREYMDIFDIRKAIENSKNIYPDVIKKELPRFDKEFNDIILEEKGEKPVEEWRRELAPSRYNINNQTNFNDSTISNNEKTINISNDLNNRLKHQENDLNYELSNNANSNNNSSGGNKITSDNRNNLINNLDNYRDYNISNNLSNQRNNNKNINVDESDTSNNSGTSNIHRLPNIFINNSEDRGETESRRNKNEFKLLESMPNMVDKRSLRDNKPVKSILSKKSSNLFAKIGPTAISRGFKDQFYDKNDSKKLDDMLLSSDIQVLSNDASKNIGLMSYKITDELKPGGTNNIILGGPIASTFDSKEEAKEIVKPYKSDNSREKEIDPNRGSLMLDQNRTNFNIKNQIRDYDPNNSKETSYFFPASSLENYNQNQEYNNDKQEKYKNENKEMNKNEFLDSAQNLNRNGVINEFNNPNRAHEYTNNDTRNEEKSMDDFISGNGTKGKFIDSGEKDTLFGAPMYDESRKQKMQSEAQPKLDIFGQLLTGDSMRISNGKIVDDNSGLENLSNLYGSNNGLTIGEVRDVDDTRKYDNINNSSNNDFNFMGSQSQQNTDNISLKPKKWKFIQDYEEEEKKPAQFNELKIHTGQNREEKNKIEPNYGSMPQNQLNSNNFINFNDLNAGKIDPRKVNEFISFSNDYETKNSKINSTDLTLESGTDDIDNYFDDFYEN